MSGKQLTAAAPEPGNGAVQVEVTLPVRPRRQHGRDSDHQDPAPGTESHSRIPRIARLMALAIKFQEMVDRGEVRDYADLARLGYVTRARLTQIMNLLLLSPDLQEMLLFTTCDTALSERRIRAAVKQVPWASQRALIKKES